MLMKQNVNNDVGKDSPVEMIATSINLVYTGGIPLWLDTDVLSVVTAKTNTALRPR